MMANAPFTFSPGALVAPGIDWLNTNLHPLFAAISTVVEAVLMAVQAVLTPLPAGALIARQSPGWRGPPAPRCRTC